MSIAVQKMFQGYEYFMHDMADPRTKDWFLISTPGPLIMILSAYLLFCSYLGPQIMKDRKPFKLKNTIMLYNIIQVILSIYMTYRGIEYVVKTNYTFTCQNVNFSDDPLNMRFAGGVWLYFFSKITELLDTVFFVLRKKDNQVTFLHLYHHTLMPILSWYGTRHAAGGQAIPEGTMNTFIHILMYGYYFVAGLGPQYQKYLWWKKYLTTLQLIQFSIITYLNVTGFFAPNCNYPKFLNIVVIMNCIAFFYMFGQFYYTSYVKTKKNTNSNGSITEKKER